MLYLAFPFYVIIFSIRGWLTQGSNISKKGDDRVPLVFVFLRMLPPSFKQVLALRENVVSQGCLWLLTQPQMEYAYLVLTNLTELQSIVVLPEFCAHWASQTPFVNMGTRISGRHAHCMCVLNMGSIIHLAFIFVPTPCTLARLSLLSLS